MSSKVTFDYSKAKSFIKDHEIESMKEKMSIQRKNNTNNMSEGR